MHYTTIANIIAAHFRPREAEEFEKRLVARARQARAASGTIERTMNRTAKSARNEHVKLSAHLLTIARSARLAGARAADLFYETIGRIIEEERFIELGFETVDEFCEDECHEPARTVRRKTRVARYATKLDWDQYGVTKLDAALSFIEASRGAPMAPRDRVDFSALKIPTKNGTKLSHVPIDKLSVEAIIAATAALTKKPKKTTRAPSEKLLLDEFSRIPGLEDGEVSVRDGRVTLSFALAQKDKVAKALVALPSTAEERAERAPEAKPKKPAPKRRNKSR